MLQLCIRTKTASDYPAVVFLYYRIRLACFALFVYEKLQITRK